MMVCKYCKTSATCTICGEGITEGQEFISYCHDSLINYGHQHMKWCCGNGLTSKMYDDIKQTKSDEKKKAKTDFKARQYNED